MLGNKYLRQIFSNSNWSVNYLPVFVFREVTSVNNKTKLIKQNNSLFLEIVNMSVILLFNIHRLQWSELFLYNNKKKNIIKTKGKIFVGNMWTQYNILIDTSDNLSLETNLLLLWNFNLDWFKSLQIKYDYFVLPNHIKYEPKLKFENLCGYIWIDCVISNLNWTC